ncbi:DUF2624 family protein [Oceanobacillus sp. FSL H7-0719]|uniref:DUF2624 family protein n=1 Tax=Oceanobacillus sp. FSL H7-0719 TaxID=2954507 RepID=UPI003251829A
MSVILKEIIKNKMKQLRKEELLYYSNQYGITLTETEAKHILKYIHENDFDIFSLQEIDKLHKKIAEITNHATANKAKNLFLQIITAYGLENYFQ